MEVLEGSLGSGSLGFAFVVPEGVKALVGRFGFRAQCLRSLVSLGAAEGWPDGG